MTIMKSHISVLLSIFLLSLICSCSPHCDQDYPEGMDLDYTDDKNQSMDGDDIVTYYNGGDVSAGIASSSSSNNGVRYLFSSPIHKALFDSNPEKYMPRAGGYCIVAAANGKVEAVDKKHYGVYNGKLYFTTNKKAHDMWMKDQEALTQKGEEMWPCLVAKSGRKI